VRKMTFSRKSGVLTGVKAALKSAIASAHGSKRPHYSLAELMAQCELDAPMSEEARAWYANNRVGREAI